MRDIVCDVRWHEWIALASVLSSVAWVATGWMGPGPSAVLLFAAWLQMAALTLMVAALRWNAHRVRICVESLEQLLKAEPAIRQRAPISGLLHFIERYTR